jgi:hypothetical protein
MAQDHCRSLCLAKRNNQINIVFFETYRGAQRATLVIVDNKQKERCKKGHRFPYYLSGTEFMTPEVKKMKKTRNRSSIKRKPLESHEFQQS